MKLLALISGILSLKTIELSIFYEREENDDAIKGSKAIIGAMLEKYNKALALVGVKIQLKNLLYFSEYLKMPQYRSLQRLAGTSMVDERIRAVEMESHAIIAISALDLENVAKKSEIDTCRSRYIININSEKYTGNAPLEILRGSLKDWMGLYLDMNIPEISDMNPDFIEQLKASNIAEELKRCHDSNGDGQNRDYRMPLNATLPSTVPQSPYQRFYGRTGSESIMNTPGRSNERHSPNNFQNVNSTAPTRPSGNPYASKAKTRRIGGKNIHTRGKRRY
ncbi:hypothetical protein ENBRE01_1085 [Enteropsectra breve]|nr:hypothetical protein ENBRE01_1085 [Enteropsectra breve]